MFNFQSSATAIVAYSTKGMYMYNSRLVIIVAVEKILR